MELETAHCGIPTAPWGVATVRAGASEDSLFGSFGRSGAQTGLSQATPGGGGLALPHWAVSMCVELHVINTQGALIALLGFAALIVLYVCSFTGACV